MKEEEEEEEGGRGRRRRDEEEEGRQRRGEEGGGGGGGMRRRRRRYVVEKALEEKVGQKSVPNLTHAMHPPIPPSPPHTHTPFFTTYDIFTQVLQFKRKNLFKLMHTQQMHIWCPRQVQGDYILMYWNVHF